MSGRVNRSIRMNPWLFETRANVMFAFGDFAVLPCWTWRFGLLNENGFANLQCM